MGLLNLPKQVFYGSLILHQRRSIELYLFFSARFIAMGRWEKRCVRKFLAVRFRQAPIEDGLDIALVQINRVKTLGFHNRFLIEKAHHTIPLPRLQRRQMFAVFPIIQYRSDLCKAGGGDFPSFVKPTEFGSSLLILKRDRVCSLLQAPPFHGIIKNSLFFRNSHILTGAGSPAGAHSMIGLGTIVNTIAIVAGGLGGLVSRRFLKERYQETVTKAIGFAIMMMALGSTLSQMLVVRLSADEAGQLSAGLDTQGTMMMVVSLAGGALLGELLDLEHWFERFGAWLRDKTGSQGDRQFIDAFVSASLTVCVGAMAIIGSIQDGISGSHDTLFAKAVLDMIIILMMTASLGKGCIFSAIPVAVFQGAVTLLAREAAPLFTEAALSNISLVGNVLIFCVGVNLVWPRTVRIANILPSIVIAAAFAAWA